MHFQHRICEALTILVLQLGHSHPSSAAAVLLDAAVAVRFRAALVANCIFVLTTVFTRCTAVQGHPRARGLELKLVTSNA